MIKVNDLFGLLDANKDMIAAFTGLKAMWVEAGWSNENAETMVVECFKCANLETLKLIQGIK